MHKKQIKVMHMYMLLILFIIWPIISLPFVFDYIGYIIETGGKWIFKIIDKTGNKVLIDNRKK